MKSTTIAIAGAVEMLSATSASAAIVKRPSWASANSSTSVPFTIASPTSPRPSRIPPA